MKTTANGVRYPIAGDPFPLAPALEIMAQSIDRVLQGQGTSLATAIANYDQKVAGYLAQVVASPAGKLWQAAQDAAAAAATALAAATAAQKAATDAAALVGAPAGDVVFAAGDPRYVKRADLVFSVRDYGAKGDGSTDDTAAFKAALAAATKVNGVVFMPPGDYVVTGGLSLSGYSCSLVGSGSTATGSGKVAGTVIRATAQTGPVLDFAGFIWPKDYSARLRFGGFAVAGDGTSGIAKRGVSITGTAAPIGVAFYDINIIKTGGVGFYAKDMYCAVVDSVTATTPVDCLVNNVPYFHLIGVNGSNFRNCLIRSTNFDAATGDTPASGAWRMEASDKWQMHLAKVDTLCVENIHVPSDGTIIVCQTNEVVLEDTQFFDCFKTTGATGTSYARFESSKILDGGGNEWRGEVPGKGTNASSIDVGIELRQNGNRVNGVKGWAFNNVLLAAGVNYCHVELAGAYSAANGYGFIDQSGTTTNTIIDHPMGRWIIGGRTGSVGLKFNGGRWIGAVPVDMGTLTGATAAFNTNNGNVFRATLGANVNFNAISGTPALGETLTVIITQDGAGRTYSMPSVIKWAGAAPSITASPGRTDVYVLVYDGTTWHEMTRAIGS